MNDTINLTLSTNPAFILALAGTVVFVTLACIGVSIKRAVKEMSDTIRRKDFKLKPEFDKRTGELRWEEAVAYNPWRFI